VNSKGIDSKSNSTHLLNFCRALLLVLGFLCVQALPSAAQSPAIPPPPPNLSLAPRSDLGPVVTISHANAASVRTQGRGGHFRLLGIGAHETVNVRLQFSPSFAGTAFFASALDGGESSASRPNSVIAADGTTSIRFKAGDQPGLYRVLIIAGEDRSLLSFWVADPKNPKANRPVL
jgi:hypothetical protein